MTIPEEVWYKPTWCPRLAPPPGLGSGGGGGPPPGIPSAPSVPSAGGQTARGGGSSGSSVITIVKAQIGFLLSSINEDNFSSRIAEIHQLSDHHGSEVYYHFLRRLIVANASALNPSGQPPAQTDLVWKLLGVEGRRVARDVLLGPLFATAIDTAGESDVFRSFSFINLADRIGLSPGERLSLGTGIVSASSLSARILEQGHQLVRDNLDSSIELLGSSAPPLPFFDPETDISPGMGTLLLTSLLTPQSPSLVSAVQRTGIIAALSNKFGPSFIGSCVASLPLPIPGLSLAEFLLELGEVSDHLALRLVMEKWGFLDGGEAALEDKTAVLLRNVIEGVVEGRGSVDGHAVVRALSTFDQGSINWSNIVESFDLTSNPLLLLSPLGFPLFLALLLNPPQSPHPPIAGLLSHLWTHANPQLVLIDRLLSLPSDTFNFSGLPSTQPILSATDVPEAPPNLLGSTWNCLEIFQVCGRAAASEDSQVRDKSKEILEKGIRSSPELVYLGLIQVPKPWPVAHADLVSRLSEMFFQHYPHNPAVFHRLWQIDQGLLLPYFARLYAQSELSLVAIVDIAQGIKALDVLLSQRPFQLALDVACLASKRELIDLGQWLDVSLEHPTLGAEFASSVLGFLRHKVASELERQELDAEARTIALTQSTVSLLLRSLSRSKVIQDRPDDLVNLADIRILALQLHPRLMALIPHSREEHGQADVKFSEDVEAEVDDIYHRMYNDGENIPVDSVVNYLGAWRDSQDPKRQEVFACMLYTLFDEYKFFHTYPSRELALTGKLFGSLILRGLVEGIPLQVAVRFVLDALKSPPEATTSNFTFGIIALTAFQTRLNDFPEVCETMLSIAHLHDSHPHLIEHVRTTLEDRRANGGAGGGAGGTGGPGGMQDGSGRSNNNKQAMTSPAPQVEIFKALRLNSFDVTSEPLEEPDESTADRILFIVNNLAPSNFEAKTQEMREAFQLRHSRWFAHYFISARVAAELNNHTLYMQFLEALNRGSLDKHILYETFASIHTLLNSDKTVTQAPDRSTLKNLGSWLGRITLARNKPIRFKHLSLKDLLIEGYDAKRLIVAIPFVCKVLEGCQTSQVFRPPNPWLMAVIRLLVELYQNADLKLNLKFEIEVLCKTLSIDLASITPTSIIRDRPVEQPISAATAGQPSLNQDLERLALGGGASGQASVGYGAGGTGGAGGAGGAGAGGPGGESTQRMSAMQLYTSEAVAAAAQAALNRKVAELIAELPHYLVFLPDAIPFNTNSTLKHIFHVAVERAIQEIVVPVVERSVTIAGISCRDLITKDFATEGDHTKMRKAAHLMVQNLAGNLATVTCKEPLRTSITTNVRALLQQNNFSDAIISSEAVVAVVASNLDLACSVIKKAAQDKAVFDVDETLTPAFNLRRRHYERSTQPFWDGTQASVNVNMLPDLLRIRPSGLQPQQLEVYEEFGRQKLTQTTGPATPLVPEGTKMQQRGGIVDRAARGVVSGTSFRAASPMSGGGLSGVGESASAAAAAAAAVAAATAAAAASGGLIEPQTSSSTLLSSEQAIIKFSRILAELAPHFSQLANSNFASLPPGHDIRVAVRQIPIIAAQSFNRDETAMAFSQKIVQLLYKTESPIEREMHVIILQSLCKLFSKVQKEVTTWLITAEDERKFNVPVTVALIRAGLLNIADLDSQLAQWILRDFRPSAISFSANLIRECIFYETPCATRGQVMRLIEALGHAVQAGKATKPALDLLDDLLAGAQGLQQPTESEMALRERLTSYFLEWVRMYRQSPSPEQAFVSIVTHLQQQGILKGEEVTFLFFRICAETGVDEYNKAKLTDSPDCLVPLDALSKLFVLLLKNYGDPNGVDVDEAKVRYLNKILSIVVLVLVQAHEELGANFDQRPFFRFFSSILNDLHSIEASLHTAYLGCLRAFSSNTLSMLQPTLLPGFAFSWMSLISHRIFMPKLLKADSDKNWPEYHNLLLALFKFIAPYLSAPKMHDASRVFFKGTMRIVLVLLHDFPEFLAEYYHSLIDAIPPHCVQFRNVILSAFPRNHSLPDPFTYHFVEGDVDKHRIPVILSDYAVALQSRDLRAAIEDCVYSDRSLPALIPALKARIAISTGGGPDGVAPAVKYNFPFLNAVVLYAGTSAVAATTNAEGLANFEFDAAAPIVRLFEALAADADPEGQYNLISSIANQLRYPNAHTWFFSHLLVHLFASCPPQQRQQPPSPADGTNGSNSVSGGGRPAAAAKAKLPEIIARVLLERVVVSRPHPWGLLVTFIQMLRLPGFWSHEFATSSPELATLFKTCSTF